MLFDADGPEKVGFPAPAEHFSIKLLQPIFSRRNKLHSKLLSGVLREKIYRQNTAKDILSQGNSSVAAESPFSRPTAARNVFLRPITLALPMLAVEFLKKNEWNRCALVVCSVDLFIIHREIQICKNTQPLPNLDQISNKVGRFVFQKKFRLKLDVYVNVRSFTQF